MGPTIHNHDALSHTPAHRVVLECLTAGIEGAHPRNVVPAAVELTNGVLTVQGDKYPLQDYSDIHVIGGGKAAVGVARELEAILGDAITDGAIVAPHPPDLSRIDTHDGSHPVPDEATVDGANAVLDTASSATASSLVITVITGGGSALLTAPAPGVALDDLVAVTAELLEAGAPIRDINTVRKQLSAIKGGRLAHAITPGRTIGLVISDVVGNDLDVVASGPTTPDATTAEAALAVLLRHGIDPPPGIQTHLDDRIAESASPDPLEFDRVTNYVIADSHTALAAAKSTAIDNGYDATILSSRIQGESRIAAGFHAAIVDEAVATGNPVKPPGIVLSGGETTVRVTGDGRGGPNLEFALATALEASSECFVVGSVDTDGLDGSTDRAGGVVTASAVEDHEAAGAALDENDSYAFLDNRGATIETGPTGTNVNDLRVIAVTDP